MALSPTSRIVLVAVFAGVLGVAAGIVLNGPGPLLGPLLRTDLGQRVLQRVVAASAPRPPEGIAIATRGAVMPTLRLRDLDGAEHALPETYAGRPILINLWASWCGPCLAEMPELDRFAATQGRNGTQVVGIALDRPEQVQAFLRRTPVAYRILIDSPGPADSGVQLGNPKGVLPYTALIAPDGRLLKQKIGPFAPGEIDGWVRR
jgi:thiol-disulfide isomerase/thioredoxin